MSESEMTAISIDANLTTNSIQFGTSMNGPLLLRFQENSSAISIDLDDTINFHTIEINERHLFLLSQVCDTLHLTDTSKIAGRIPTKYKFKLKHNGTNSWYINSKGLFHLIFRSRSRCLEKARVNLIDYVFELINHASSISNIENQQLLIRNTLQAMNHFSVMDESLLTDDLRTSVIHRNQLNPKPCDVVEIAKELGFVKLPFGNRSSLGRKVAKQFQDHFGREPTTHRSVVNGKFRQTNIYMEPDEYEFVKHTIRDIFSMEQQQKERNNNGSNIMDYFS